MTGERWHLLSAGLGAAILLGVLHHIAPGSTARFFGGLHPLPIVLAITGAGLLGLRLLRAPGGWALAGSRPRPAIQAILALACALPFCVAVTLADLAFRFPEGINLTGGAGAVFYPAMAVVAVICFHILPAALIAGLRRALTRPAGRPLPWLPAALAAALVEPLFQISHAGAFSPISGFTFLHVFAFNLLALHLLRVWGFLPSLLMRLGYYAWWHLIWGALRLDLLFA
ncbi:MAG: hypothetical protein C0456_02370 [Hyphomonas sp.]|uniref:hypothetical protein n=1 Tax=Hyphomonas sp. TaxID=87 RepID=UPI001D9819CE|nr:hypothetical protein [Hyphomonas sp.]MBA4225449.1 hypothetical protein [Hyphomonas sp.]